MKLLVIGNPVSGGGTARRIIEEMGNLLEARGHEVETYLTGAAGDAKRRASQLDARCEAVIVAGGDGTLNEVINGLDLSRSLPIAFVPAGTGNVIAYELRLRRPLADIVGYIECGQVRNIDLGLIGDRRFLMLASAGFDALVTREVQRSRRGTFWRGAYAVPILRSLWQYKIPDLQVSVDGVEVEGGLAIVNKTPFYGGVLTIAHRARCDSGHFDVCVFPNASLPALAQYGLAAWIGKAATLKGMTYLTGTHVEITASEAVHVQVDGDYFGTTPVVMDLVPAAVPIYAPPSRPA